MKLYELIQELEKLEQQGMRDYEVYIETGTLTLECIRIYDNVKSIDLVMTSVYR